MPRGDGTGPLGTGSRTGRGAGFCTGYDVAGYANPWRERGFFCRRGHSRGGAATGPGRGFRWQNWYNATGQPFWVRDRQFWWNRPQTPGSSYGGSFTNKESEIEFLKKEASALEEELNQIKTRIENLNKNT